MSRITACFANKDHPLLIAFLVACDPDRDTALGAAKAVIEGGADILELGVPYSDPIADGPTIQRAHVRALENGARLNDVFSQIRELRRHYDTPIVLLVYCNMVMQRGVKRFYLDSKEAGVDGVIVVDMPPEEAGEALEAAEEAGLDEIFLVSETTSPERLRLITSLSRGFVYLVSTLGVTGIRDRLPEGIAALIGRVKDASPLPVALGFGVSTPEHAREVVLSGADGVIVGSAIVQLLEHHLGREEGLSDALERFVRELKEAVIDAGRCRQGGRRNRLMRLPP